MKRSAFEDNNEQAWRDLENMVTSIEGKKPVIDKWRLPQLFRQVCGDLALAQHRMYGRRLCDRLNALVIGSYQLLQNAARRGTGSLGQFLGATLPRAVRAEYRLVWLSFALFFVPFAGFIIAAYFDPKWIHAILGPESRQMMDKMYGSETTDEFIRDQFGSNFKMFGFYIYNNVSINFRIFAGGVLVVLGASLAIAYQGIFIGAMFGYVHQAGNIERLYTFCASHSSFELLGFILGGAAGMRLGMALVAPGRLTRHEAVREAGRRAFPILMGSTLMISLAAVIEAFWSPSAAPPWMKYSVGIAGWVMFALYYTFAGRVADAT
jgi:uncharacterized membrane protein SpoIIM required for sporulation